MLSTNKKRGRRRKELVIEEEKDEDKNKDKNKEDKDKDKNKEDKEKEKEKDKEETPLLKKRGRKPKGGKLINKNIIETQQQVISTNVILHLKCSLKDIKFQKTDPLAYNPAVPPEIMSYDDNKHGFSYYSNILNSNSNTNSNTTPTENITIIPDNKLAYLDNICKKCNNSITNDTINNEEEDTISLKDINSKLKDLRIQFYKNSLNDKKSACFWCSYEFDNQSCYIPKYELDDTICGYGSFCRPECAVGYLMKENIDDSTKFERYQLLNHIYSKVYGYKKNIKPAPNPYYLLDKYYGTLSIQEYRKLLKTEHMLLVIDKPLTKILPELHDDNDEFILNIYGGVKTTASTGGIYKVKRQSEKTQGPTKNSIIKDKFGLS
jgi:hypothetical protein